jgi:hypothetical protein
MSDEKPVAEQFDALGHALGAPQSAPKFIDPRPTDLEVFFSLLPGVMGGLAAKGGDLRSINSSAFIVVREALGQCAAMGALRPTFVCIDGTPLVMMPNNMPIPGVQAPVSQQQAQGNGIMVAQHPNQPGQGQAAQQPGVGGLVSQFPTQAQPVQHGGGMVGGQQPNFGNGSRGVMVAQFPNGTTPPQL